MSRFAVGAVAFAGVHAAEPMASTLKLTWSDCGDSSTHTKITSFQPATATSGAKTVMTGSGSIDEDVPGATFDLEMKTAVGTVSCKGDASASKTCNLPLGTGSLTFEAMTFPINKGSTSVNVDLTLSALLPASLATTDTRVTATGADGSKIFCVDIKSAPAALSENVKDEFDQFMQHFERRYASTYEQEYRRKVFFENLALIGAENAKGKSYKLGVTDFADLTFSEFQSKYLTGFVATNRTQSLSTFKAPVGFAEADSVDWSTNGAVTPVKNQAQCGSCWSFSTTGALEGASFIAGRGLTSLSEQNILDCDKGGNKCQGGSMDQAFGWVQENGICSEAGDSYKCADQYSATCQDSQCPTDCTQVLKPGDVTGYTDVSQTEGALEAAVMKQPVSVAIEADQAVFQHYTSGVLTDEACGESLDHGVLAVGYGEDNGQKYWKVKNSWGTSFGESGYIRIEKGSAQAGGECGIRKMASYPTVAAASNEVIV